jgi:ABC-type branched-subunit amino acid transport system ATPase component
LAAEAHSQVALKVDGLNQFYGGSHILRNLSFEAKQGEVTVILGRNGVGKTTLLKSLMGVVPIKAGTVSLHGQNHRQDITRGCKVAWVMCRRAGKSSAGLQFKKI